VLYGSDAAKSTHVNLGVGSTTGRTGADDPWCTVGGGISNVASFSSATVAGGNINRAEADYSTVAGGVYNFVSSSYATIGGGGRNSASGYFATVPGGYMADAAMTGQMAYASGGFASWPAGNGTAQTSVFVLRNSTTSTMTTDLFLDGASNRLTVAPGRTMTFDILVVGREDGTGNSAGWRIQGVIKNTGSVSFVGGTPTPVSLGNDGIGTAGVRITAGDLAVFVTPASSTTTRWSATVHTTEVAF
jgi:hypothetical protein